jgi:hypothetical protein
VRLDERYIQLGLRLGRHVDGYVDAYFGPAELKERIDVEQVRDPAALVGEAEELQAAIDAADLEPQRERWLCAQVRAMHATARRVAGEDLGYVEEVELNYGIQPRRTPESAFEAARRELDDALPGDGDVRARLAAWLEHELPGEKQLVLLEGISAELRARVRDSIGLPDGETVEYEAVRNKPWTGFNYYEGNLRSRVAINVDLPLPPTQFLHFVAHETYPGHHTERTWKETIFVDERDQLEQSIALLVSPEAVIAEGIAEYGGRHFFPDAHELVQAHLAREGIDYDPDVARRVGEARNILAGALTNAAQMLYVDGVSIDDVKEYMLEWTLLSEHRVDKALQFVTDPLSRTYVHSYGEGERLTVGFVGGDPTRFKRLLTEQLTPADLA